MRLRKWPRRVAILKVMSRMSRVLLILVDGVGLPTERLEESIYSECPFLLELFLGHGVPVDARLGVDGTPQSATGQTAILTGVNAAALLGTHLHGFPNRALRKVIESDNLFIRLLKRGISCTFATPPRAGRARPCLPVCRCVGAMWS